MCDRTVDWNQARGGGSSGSRVREDGCETINDAGDSGRIPSRRAIEERAVKLAPPHGAIVLHSCEVLGALHGWPELDRLDALPSRPFIPSIESRRP